MQAYNVHNDQDWFDELNLQPTKNFISEAGKDAGKDADKPKSQRPQRLKDFENEIARPKVQTEEDDHLKGLMTYIFERPAREADEKDEEYEKRCKIPIRKYRKDSLYFQNIAKAETARYFDMEGNPLIDDKTEQFFSAHYDRHMPYFAAYIIGEIPSDDYLPAEPFEDHPIDATKFQSTGKEPDPIEVPQDAFHDPTATIRRSAHVWVNHKALKYLYIIDIMKEEEFSKADNDTINGMPDSVLDYIKEQVEAEEHPVLIHIGFDLDFANLYRVFIGIPPFGQRFATTVQKGYLIAVINGDAGFPGRCRIIKRLLDEQNKSGNSLNDWFKSPDRHVFDPFHMTTAKVDRVQFQYQPRTTWFGTHELLVVQAVLLLQKREYEQKICSTFSASKFRLHLVKVRDGGNHVYNGWLTQPPKAITPKAGTLLDVIFPSQFAKVASKLGKIEVWMAQVSEVNIGPREMIPLTISRYWNPEIKVFSEEDVSVVDTSEHSSLIDAVRVDEGNEVLINLRPQMKVNKAQMHALDDLNRPQNNRPPLTQWNHDAMLAVEGSRIHQLQSYDIFRELREEFSDVTAVMRLNKMQKEAVLSMATAPGGIAIVQGPPGTGKSTLACEILKPFLLSKTHRQVLMVTSANAAVDDVTCRVQKVINDYRNEGKLTEKGYILRVYAPNSEKAIREIEADYQTKPKRDMSYKRPPNLQKIDSTNNKKFRPLSEQEQKVNDALLVDAVLDASTRQYLTEFKALHKGKFAGLRDKRVRNPDRSVTMKMLEVIGIRKGPDTYPDEERFAKLRKMIRQLGDGKLSDDKDVRKAYTAALNQATEFTMKEAWVIITTTDNAGLQGVVGNIEDTCRLVIADEAPREILASYFPLFAARFDLLGFIALGGWLQLVPITPKMEGDNAYVKQEKVPFMSALIHMGFPYSTLTEQHRMNQELCDMANALTYNNRLTTHPDVMQKRAYLTNEFRKWAQKHWGKRTAKGLIDVKRSMSNHTMTERMSSRYNDMFVVLAITIAEQLIEIHPLATVAMIAPYSAQRDRLKKAAKSLKIQRPEQFTGNPERLFVLTVDSTQGMEFDFVVDQLLITEGGLGFQSDAHRGNVATTRAKHGYVLLVDREMLKHCHGPKTIWVAKLIDHLMPWCKEEKPSNEFPVCRYYAPDKPTGAYRSDAGHVSAVFAALKKP